MKIASEARAKLHFAIEENKVYTLDIPISSKLGEIYDVLIQMKEEVWKSLEEQKNKEQSEKEKGKEKNDQPKSEDKK